MTTTLAKKTKAQKRGKLADTHHVDQLISNYKKERWVHNSGRMKKTDSLSTWYGLEELSDFLQLARENQADGIKMYFGVYPDDFAETPEFQGLQTIVLVATKQKATGNGTINKDIYLYKDGKSEILAFNFGSACPPFCTPGLSPYGNGNFGIDLEKIGLSIIDNNDRIMII